MLEAIDACFNSELQMQADDVLPKGHIYRLGHPGKILLLAGIQDLPMELSADKLSRKSSKCYYNNHPFDISEAKGLPKAINSPIAVFNSTKKDGAKIILTELKDRSGVNFVAAIKIRGYALGRKTCSPVNSVVSVYPKDDIKGLINWINSGNKLICWVDKEKALDFVSTQSTSLIAGENSTQGLNLKLFESAKNVISNFRNP